MSHFTDADELLEILGDELWTIVRDDPGLHAGKPLARPLNDRLDLSLGHALANLPVDDEPAATVQKAAEVIEGASDVDVRDIDVLVLVRLHGLLKALTFERGLGVVVPHQPSIVEHPVDAGGTDGDDIGVEHHEGKSAVAFQGMPGVKVEDGLFLPGFQPPIAGDQRVVLVGQPVARTPVIELARGDSQPRDEPLNGNLRASRPLANVIDDRIANVVGDPGAG